MMHDDPPALARRNHTFLSPAHSAYERRAWAAIVLTAVMMVVEIGGGTLFGSLAVVADGFHMATHAIAFLLAALAYTYARKHAADPRFVWGTGKLGDLAGFTSAIILGLISLGIGFDAVLRLISPVAIKFNEAILIACAGLAVNVVTAWLLGGSGSEWHRHPHQHQGNSVIGHLPAEEALESMLTFVPGLLGGGTSAAPAAARDHNIRAAFVHVAADAAVSVLAIFGLLLGRFLGWAFMDPVMGIGGALVIASWAFFLLRDTGSVLLDMTPDEAMAGELKRLIESGGDRVADFHLWRVGPGHLAAIVSVLAAAPREPEFYHSRLSGFRMLSHVTVEVVNAKPRQSGRSARAGGCG